MHRLLHDFLDEIEAAGTTRQLRQALSRFAIGMDLPTFAYIAIPSTTRSSFA